MELMENIVFGENMVLTDLKLRLMFKQKNMPANYNVVFACRPFF